MKSIKILFVVTEDWYFVSHRLDLAIAAKKAGYDVVIATRVSCHKKKIESLGIRVIPLKCMIRSSLNPLREFKALYEIYSLYKKEKPDLVHHVALKPAVYGSFSSRLLGIKAQVNALGGLGFVFSSNRLLARSLRPFIKQLLRFLLNGSQQRTILQNEHDVSVLVDNNVVQKKYVRLIRGAGVDLSLYKHSELPSGIPIIMMASRLLADKGVREFVGAAKMFKKTGKHARFVLVGVPDPESPASITTQELKIWQSEGAVELWGHSSDMPYTISQATIFVLPSFYGEGLPKVLIEAAACGRPIVTTDRPGCRDAVEIEETGLVVPPRDIISLKDSLERLLDDPELCMLMGNKARILAETRFDVEAVIEEHLRIYKETLV